MRVRSRSTAARFASSPSSSQRARLSSSSCDRVAKLAAIDVEQAQVHLDRRQPLARPQLAILLGGEAAGFERLAVPPEVVQHQPDIHSGRRGQLADAGRLAVRPRLPEAGERLLQVAAPPVHQPEVDRLAGHVQPELWPARPQVRQVALAPARCPRRSVRGSAAPRRGRSASGPRRRPGRARRTRPPPPRIEARNARRGQRSGARRLPRAEPAPALAAGLLGQPRLGPSGTRVRVLQVEPLDLARQLSPALARLLDRSLVRHRGS